MHDSIAIVGMACRFPMARDVDAYWDLLTAGTDAIVSTPPERWDAATIDAVRDNDTTTPITRWGGFIDDCDKFDADFFRMSPQEAARVDPQQRMMLELTWTALEDAGIAPSALSGRKVGVFVGASHSDYERIMYREIAGITGFEGPGAYHAIIANRVSYFFNFKGPSMVVDTACSSSLSALHVAAQALRGGDCELAIVAGVSLNLTPEETMSLSKAHMLSPTGRSMAFDDRADGFVRGEGLGVLVLTTSKHAEQSALRVRALVVGSAVNQDGTSNGLMAPNGLAQRALLNDALSNAKLLPRQLDYVETHGTGTALGDSIEFGALRDVFGSERDVPLLIGSVKTNIGHLEAASGVASIIKVVLAMEHEVIPKQLHFERPNRYIELHGSGLAVCSDARPWPQGTEPRYAGISAFGFGGTNAHTLLRSAAPAIPRQSPAQREVLLLSAKTPQALRALARRMVDFLATTSLGLDEICFTMAAGRDHFPWRWAGAASDIAELKGKLSAWLASERDPRPVKSRRLGLWLSGTADDLAQARVLRYRLLQWGLKPLVTIGQRSALPELLRPRPVDEPAIETSGSLTEAIDAFRSARCDLVLQIGGEVAQQDLETVAASSCLDLAPDMLADLYCAGVSVSWSSYYAPRDLLPVSLPTYPFARHRHWVTAVNHPDEGRMSRASLGSSLIDIGACSKSIS